MPKIIENLPHRLMEEARRQIRQDGYGALTIRSVAKACGVGVGTVYNYYPSKDALVAAFMLEDWQQCMAEICACSRNSDTAEPVLRSMYDNLTAFSSRYETIFRDESAIAGFSGSFSRYHSILRDQLSDPLRKFFCEPFPPDFIAEAMLVWTVSGKEFHDIFSLIQKLL